MKKPDISLLELDKIIDVERIGNLFRRFYELTGISGALLDNSGKIVVESGWAEVCTKYHFKCKTSDKRCARNNPEIFKSIGTSSDYVIFTCGNYLTHAAYPVLVDGKHILTFLTGQFFLEEPDLDNFKKLADFCCFDRDEYLESVKNVPVIPVEKIHATMGYYIEFLMLLAEDGVKKLALLRTEKELEMRNNDLKDMMYVASHDLQSPLISIKGFITVFINKYGRKIEEGGLHALERVQVNLDRMHSLILSLLDISRVATQKNKFEIFSAKETAEKAASDLELVAHKAGAEINIYDMPGIFGDKVRIETLFRNLIQNAINYGGKHISAGYRARTGFYVKDDGIGIDPDYLGKIFKPGERLKDVDVEGSGMGLAFCRKVIEMHGGRIWAESAGKGKGAVFYFTISEREKNEQSQLF